MSKEAFEQLEPKIRVELERRHREWDRWLDDFYSLSESERGAILESWLDRRGETMTDGHRNLIRERSLP